MTIHTNAYPCEIRNGHRSSRWCDARLGTYPDVQNLNTWVHTRWFRGIIDILMHKYIFIVTRKSHFDPISVVHLFPKVLSSVRALFLLRREYGGAKSVSSFAGTNYNFSTFRLEPLEKIYMWCFICFGFCLSGSCFKCCKYFCSRQYSRL